MAETAIKKFVNFFWGEDTEEGYDQVDSVVEYDDDGYDNEEEPEIRSFNPFRKNVVAMPWVKENRNSLAGRKGRMFGIFCLLFLISSRSCCIIFSTDMKKCPTGHSGTADSWPSVRPMKEGG